MKHILLLTLTLLSASAAYAQVNTNGMTNIVVVMETNRLTIVTPQASIDALRKEWKVWKASTGETNVLFKDWVETAVSEAVQVWSMNAPGRMNWRIKQAIDNPTVTDANLEQAITILKR